MPSLTAQQVENLVGKAFVIEAIAPKDGCTNRYTDLPNLPLEGFVLAGLNVMPYFAAFTHSRTRGSKRLFQYFVPALMASNSHKADKYVNFGLLEIMFPVVAARLATNNPEKVMGKLQKALRDAPKSDVTAMLQARKTAWSTSRNPKKNIHEFANKITDASSPAEFYTNIHEQVDHDTSSWQWTHQFHEGWPLLEEMFQGLQKSSSESISKAVAEIFNPVRAQNPEIRIGILADLCAAAIFLHLSFQSA